MLGGETFVDHFDEILARADDVRSDSLAGVVEEWSAAALETDPGSDHACHGVCVELALLVAKSNREISLAVHDKSLSAASGLIEFHVDHEAFNRDQSVVTDTGLNEVGSEDQRTGKIPRAATADLVDNNVGPVEPSGDIAVDFDKFAQRRKLVVGDLKEEPAGDILPVKSSVEMGNHGDSQNDRRGHPRFGMSQQANLINGPQSFD